ncbi:acetylserotonin N-methyltransferase [Altererythrobacter atlanticus]|uniref:Multifunctional cyclase-dehydratase-3-O-methyl transferase TcmN n=1 Tax=Croceibacterium atlanticum TaxID=1267766 RepID=A0A0F7KQ91_9SPHN|nr:methyltransferase [Croceibacterium atlanticum]AKH41312.1 Multifunctional cyclase-dehydratase-3-O-methyl transferase TcmN [Croceibacterium atlanticum]MBB5732830.1 acetylserotonin N-methyltransferase [Croceibacterium atlanticum]
MGPLPPSQDDRTIWDIWESQFRLPVATVADELGILHRLSDKALTTAELAGELELHEHSLSILLAALASSDLVEKRGGKWSAMPAARTWLHPEAEGYWGGFLFRFRESNPLHGQLLNAMKTGLRPEDMTSGAVEWERGDMSAEAAERIGAFMHAHSQAPARGAAVQRVFSEIGTLMDVGCGSGVYGIEIARANPALKVTLLDLDAMADEAGKYVTRAGLTGRVSTHGCNMFEDEWPTGHDAHFFSNVFHDWSEETNRLLAAKSFAALPSGGRIFLNEILMDDEGTGPWQAAAFSVMMLLGTLGKQYSLPEYRAILESAGFTDVQAVRTGGGYYSLVSARKP